MHYNCILAEIFLSIKPGVRDEKTVHGAGRTGKNKKRYKVHGENDDGSIGPRTKVFLFHGPR